ncbi:putative glycolipid-binding domain-containing protein [Streptomyces sp. NPDC085481]|uniref:putative glycolipid-binding domain-containing protein n=1 Tax=Streptomyces sp. NPDC085481 TaxID=3365727 RepID=UPI0037D659C0
MTFTEPPAAAAWQHREARSGFEVAWLHRSPDGLHLDGCTTAIEDGRIWAVEYSIRLDAHWHTRGAHVAGRSADGVRQIRLEADGTGHWLIDGTPAPHLDGCLDVDLESSALTNALPVRRMDLPIGATANAPAAYVTAPHLTVERLDQTYHRTTDQSRHQRYDYTAPAFHFTCRLVYDESGLPLDYPGIATRVT